MKLLTYKIVDLFFKLLNRILIVFIKPDMVFDSVKSLNIDIIEKLKAEHNIEAAILDVDETLRTNFNTIPKYNWEWIKELKKHVKVIVVSNGLDSEVGKHFNQIGIEYIPIAFKPLKRGFKKACRILDVNPENVIVIGNDLWGDIYGGKRNNMKTALIENV